jgi:hypothetical protein
MYESILTHLKRTPLWYAYYRLRTFFFAGSQSNESAILKSLAVNCPKTFVEFGFHPHEYNCASLVDFEGLLIDGDSATVNLARRVLPRRIQVENLFLKRDKVDVISTRFERIGVLSIDIDGNDYWMAEVLLPLRPSVLVIEYNASLGARSITVPYDPGFERIAKHPSGWYHGASLEALTRLCKQWKFKLVAVSSGGLNAFFVPESRSDLMALDAADAYRENVLRNHWSGKTAIEQWETIKEMPYIQV